MKKSLQLMVLGLSFLLLISACGGKGNNDENVIEFTEDEFAEESEVVLIVNETAILGHEYNYNYMQTKVRMHQFRQDISDLERLKQQTIDDMIDQVLLIQEAEKKGIEISDEDVEEQVEAIKEEAGEEQFAAYLEQYRLTEEDYKEQVYFTLLQEQYMQTEIPEVEVTEEEVEDLYEQLKEENEDFPDLEEMADRIELEIASQKELEILLEKIEQLREDADIEILI